MNCNLRDIRYRQFVVGALLFAWAACVNPTAAWCQEDSTDPSDPKAVAVAFFTAIAEQKPEQALNHVLEPEKLRAWVESQCELGRAFDRWNEVMGEALGKNAAKVLMPNPIDISTTRCHAVDVTVSGDTAEFPVNPVNPMTIRRVEGVWKLDIFSAYRKPDMLSILGASTSEEGLGHFTQTTVENTRMLNAICDDVENKRLTTVAEIRKRLRSDRDQIALKIFEARQKAPPSVEGEGDK